MSNVVPSMAIPALRISCEANDCFFRGLPSRKCTLEAPKLIFGKDPKVAIDCKSRFSLVVKKEN
jgi:hypothetical protein